MVATYVVLLDTYFAGCATAPTDVSHLTMTPPTCNYSPTACLASRVCLTPNLNIPTNNFITFTRTPLISVQAQAAALAVKSAPNILNWALCMMAVRTVWLVAAVTALVGSVAAFASPSGPSGDHIVVEFFMLLVWGLSVVWQFTVVNNVVGATVASSVASWCSSPGNVEPVWGSFRRVMHSSLG